MDVILVDEFDNPIGTMHKMEVHEKALLHRAFSIFIFNSNGEMLIQRRAAHKYHSAGLWTNACCSHPRPGETTEAAAARRLQEEMGFCTLLQKEFAFTYKADFDNGLAEHEYDHVFTGLFDGAIHFNPEEVSEYRYISMQQLKEWMQQNPEAFTAWFKIALPQLEAHLQQRA